MEITFLGTGTSQGVPMIGCNCAICSSTDPRDKRLRTAALITSENTSVVIDSGPDFRQQMLREKVTSLDAVIFTHEHKDHIAGLDDVRAFNYFSGKPMDVYATERVQTALRREFAYVFSNENYPGVPRINLHTIHPGVPFQVGDMKIRPFEVMHYNLPVMGFRIGGICYITDANFIPEASDEFIYDADLLVLNVLRKEKHVSHFCYDEGLELVKKYRPRSTYFTHISHQLGLHAAVNHSLPQGIRCAYDGLKVEV